MVESLSEHVRTRAGLDWLREVADGTLPHPGIARTLALRLTAIEAGRAVFEGEPDERFCNPIGVIAGGYAGAVLDLTLGCAVHATLPVGAICPTLTQSTTFHRALEPGMGTIRCEATVVSAGRRVAAGEARLTDPSGRLCAAASATFLLVHPEPGRGTGAVS